ncbi:permease [Halapricum hydrolyticum]|uniref:Permease n=1 Tax=Halapricum hydrolyticum TaxID=2979991 RepID=A0AAE3ID27_9EURY|nr:permease [Halapricum hydrolyticum]MCU4718796.1 permease [Halapricum hydrolyticum]MCU4727796.1 permease [Halapricum hydrolyticum]
MSPVDVFVPVIRAGIDETLSYLTLHVITCLVPAFFIAGGISAVLSDRFIKKYLSSDAPKLQAYSLASVSGIALAVCSCTILPMFAGLYKKGAGIGPATAFLFSGPAINVLAIVFTARVLGLPLGGARAFFAVAMAAGIGLTMALVFGSSDDSESPEGQTVATDGGYVAERDRPLWVTGGFFGSQVAILLIAATGLLTWAVKAPLLAPWFALLGYLLYAQFDRDVIEEWLQETWFFTKTIFPLLIAGTFVIGIIGAIAAMAQGMGPLETVTTEAGETFKAHQVAPGLLTQGIFGETTLLSSGLASVIGAVLYMPTLLEVPIIGSLFGYTNGLMADGPALALLLAGPSLSLPNMLVIWKTIGTKRTALYISLVAAAATGAGLIWGLLIV